MNLLCGEAAGDALPLIYDLRVAQSLRTLHGEDVWPIPAKGLPRQPYTSYCLPAAECASQLGRTPDDVEVALSTLTRM